MSIPKHLISSFLLLIFVIIQTPRAIGEIKSAIVCDALEVEVSINDSKIVNISIRGSQGKARVFIIDADNILVNSKDIFKVKYTDLKSGKYKVIVSDLSGCSKETEFTLR